MTAFNRLTAKEAAFVDMYLLTANAVQAYAKLFRASDAAVRAPKLLKKPAVRDAIAEKRLAIALAHGTNEEVSFEWITKQLQRIVKDNVAGLGEDETAIKAIAELNRMFGHIAPVKTINQNTNVNIEATLEALKEARDKYKKDY